MYTMYRAEKPYHYLSKVQKLLEPLEKSKTDRSDRVSAPAFFPLVGRYLKIQNVGRLKTEKNSEKFA